MVKLQILVAPYSTMNTVICFVSLVSRMNHEMLLDSPLSGRSANFYHRQNWLPEFDNLPEIPDNV